MSSDGIFLAVGHSGTTAPAYLITYKWNEASFRYEKTASPDTAPSATCYGVGMSADGKLLAAASNATGDMILYLWNETNNRYEKTTDPSPLPSGSPRSVAMSVEGHFLAALHSGASVNPSIITYKNTSISHTIKAYKAAAGLPTVSSALQYLGVITEAGESNQVKAAKMLMWRSEDPLATLDP